MKKLAFISTIIFCLFPWHAQSATHNESIGTILRNHEKSQAIALEQEDFERRRRELQYEAKLQEEREKLERERLARLAKENSPVSSSLPDLDKAPSWAEVQAKPAFKELTPEERTQAKAAYFDYWIAPHAGGRGAELRQKFLDADRSLSDRLLQSFVTYWQYSLACLIFLLALFFRKKLTAVGSYLVENAFRIAALAGALMCIALVIRSLNGPIFVLLSR